MPLVPPLQLEPYTLKHLWLKVLQSEAEVFYDDEGNACPKVLISRASYQILKNLPQFHENGFNLFSFEVQKMPCYDFIAGAWTLAKRPELSDYEDLCVMNDNPELRWTVRFKKFSFLGSYHCS